MAKFVEMDYRVKFKDQIEEKIMGSVILINKFKSLSQNYLPINYYAVC